ncbi:MAG TPA: hypothetical protein VMU19_14580 [Bryobacteraceae bacterium]|nr:hypothetical protein [Bryobacteraceae bacterium]
MVRLIPLAVVAALLPLGALADPVTWTLTGVTFADGATASGSFVFDADTLTFSSIDVVFSPVGGSPVTFTYLCATSQCSPWIDGYNGPFLTVPSSSDLTGTPGFWLGTPEAFGGPGPDQPMTDAGGAIPLFGPNAYTYEATIADSIWGDTVEHPPDLAISGSIVATPEPGSPLWIYTVITTLLLAVLGRRRQPGIRRV